MLSRTHRSLICSPRVSSIAVIFAVLAHGTAQEPTPTPPPTTSVQIVNATCVPEIKLSINGKLCYPSFPQGIYTGDAPAPTLSAWYEAEDKFSQLRAKSANINYKPDAQQSLVILGDFSTDAPPGTLRQPGPPPSPPDHPYPPNVLYRVYPHGDEDKLVRLRIINGIPGKLLVFSSGQQRLSIKPGFDAILEQQPPICQYSADIDGEQVAVQVHQVSLIRNAMVIFFLKDGKPDYRNIYENTKVSSQKLRQMQDEN